MTAFATNLAYIIFDVLGRDERKGRSLDRELMRRLYRNWASSPVRVDRSTAESFSPPAESTPPARVNSESP